MTTYFVSRHPGARDWACEQGILVDQQVEHLQVEKVQAGDWVLGTLPVHLAGIVCERGARYFHLSMEVAQALRGKDMSAAQMAVCGARLECYDIRRHALASLPRQAPGRPANFQHSEIDR
ncbi:MAG TPA: CRISPR-associated protein Csx16 [Nevskiaceae bacterium]|nr:CRISPR-associated protein Csx16 [Nevskiaceae bacterium]